MDMKKKLEDAYAPDKQARKEKILLGLFGMDSLVTAYLLKIQKYEVLAVTVVPSWDEFTGDQAEVFSCHISLERIEKLKEICHKIGIPYQVVKLSTEFKELVIEPWIADKIQGQRPKPCWNCHELRMVTLYQKMKEAGATHFATGHFAKLFHHEGHKSVFVHTSADELNDQSALLSRLSHEILESLMLPLSDLSKKEVLKLAENFGVQEETRKIKTHECLRMTPVMGELLTKKIPKKLVKEGDISNIDGSLNYGQHEGVHTYTLGEPVEVKDSAKALKGVFGEYSYHDKRIIVGPESQFITDKIMLINVHFSEEVSWIEPQKGLVVTKENVYIECWIFPKTLSTVSIVLNEKVKLLPGEVVSVVKKKGKNSKVFLTGEVQLVTEEIIEDKGEPNVPKYDPILDF
jgi:tRNA U34 2-thiouridine synthase MnmA/TrmU